MLRTERMVKDDDIRHKIETYNELLGGTPSRRFGPTVAVTWSASLSAAQGKGFPLLPRLMKGTHHE